MCPDMPVNPGGDGPRASDEDRERVAEQLHQHYAEGRLSLDELQRRIDAVFAAQTLYELYDLTNDLPHLGPTVSHRSATSRRRRAWWPFR